MTNKPDVEIEVGTPTGKPDDTGAISAQGPQPEPVAQAPGPDQLQPAGQASEENMKNLLKFGFAGMAKWKGDHWELQNVQVDLYGPALARTLSKYTGGLSDEWSDESLLIFGLGSHIVTSVMKDRQKNAKPAKTLQDWAKENRANQTSDESTRPEPAFDPDVFQNRPEEAGQVVSIGGDVYELDAEQ